MGSIANTALPLPMTSWRAALVLLAGIGCVVFGSGSGVAEERSVWRDHGEFVRLEPQDGGAAPNSHPVRMSAEQIIQALGDLKVKDPSRKKPFDLFTASQLRRLSQHLSEALAQARPSEDVTFASLGNQLGASGLKEPKVTTGRLFYSNGSLNLILGEVLAVARDEDNWARQSDQRSAPYAPGQRQTVSRFSAALFEKPGGAVYLHQPDRHDWMVFSSEAVSQAAPAQAPAGTPAGNDTARSVQERLQVIDDLRRRGIITEEEARAKRKQILDPL
jgi:hypothetical protein